MSIYMLLFASRTALFNPLTNWYTWLYTMQRKCKNNIVFVGYRFYDNIPFLYILSIQLDTKENTSLEGKIEKYGSRNAHPF